MVLGDYLATHSLANEYQKSELGKSVLKKERKHRPFVIVYCNRHLII